MNLYSMVTKEIDLDLLKEDYRVTIIPVKRNG